jgi:hypothetical protein
VKHEKRTPTMGIVFDAGQYGEIRDTSNFRHDRAAFQELIPAIGATPILICEGGQEIADRVSVLRYRYGTTVHEFCGCYEGRAAQRALVGGEHSPTLRVLLENLTRDARICIEEHLEKAAGSADSNRERSGELPACASAKVTKKRLRPQVEQRL